MISETKTVANGGRAKKEGRSAKRIRERIPLLCALSAEDPWRDRGFLDRWE